jgi:Zn-dependent M28 family amino/carboxypeptidase
MKCSYLVITVLGLSLALPGCSSKMVKNSASVAFPGIDADAVLRHTKVLSSDEYEGRAPGTKGEDLAVRYIVDQFKSIGLKPGNTDGSYIQKVPLVGITTDPNVTLTFNKEGKKLTLKFKDDFVAGTMHISEIAEISNSEVVFVGYGVQAPEFSWDDYKAADVKGKTLVMLVGDPPVPDPGNLTQLDPKVFGGKAMTYYGRWTYKYEIGAKLGAAGVLIVHETGPAGYPFSVLQGGGAEQFDLVAPDRNMGRAAVEGWITLDQAKRLFTLAGKDFDTLKKFAVRRDFKPVPFGVKASIALHNKIRTIDSRNVAGLVEGSDPKLKNEYIVYTSHWDHLGIGPEVKGSKIYHGAMDNASGVGGLIEISRAYARASTPPKRSILFLAVTAEEQGLLGSEYYARNPIYPLAKTLAVINMDGLNFHGRTKDLTIVGLGNSDLDDYATQVASEQSRVVKPDPMPEKGSYYRSDHFPFAKQGVPALESGSGLEYIGRPEGWGKQIRDQYIANDYHQPSDVIKPDWNSDGAVQDLQYYWMVGYRVAQADRYPQWKSGTEFKALREQQLKANGR